MESDVIFKAMADRTRQRALSVLGRQELSVGELVDVLDQPQSTVSRHLRVLRDAGLIRDRRLGHTVHYALDQTSDAANGVGLVTRLIEWVQEQPLEGPLAARLAQVIDRRRAMSRSFFERIGHEWDMLREESFGGQFHLEAFISLLPQTWKVVDVGTGTGFLLPTLGRYFSRVIGVEPVERMLEVARQRVRSSELPNVELRQGDITDLPISDASADLAIAALVLHHVPAPAEAVMELGRIVKPGGRVMLIEQAAHDNEAFRERMQDRWWGFEPSDFAPMLQTAGFTNVMTRGLLNVAGATDAPHLFVVAAEKRAGGT